ncbi:MAG: T9SS type A sorting domain-containing protein [Bacteroidia bacterium]
MTRYLPVFSVFFLLSSLSTAQTGPGGVGSSANNKLWLDANSGVTTSGSSVTAWADRSGNGFSATPNAVANEPTLTAAAVNTMPAFSFDGTDDELRVPDNNSLDLTAWHFYIVAKVTTGKDYNAWFTKGDDGLENYEMLSYSTNNLHSPFYYGTGRNSPSTAAGSQFTTTEFNIIEYSYTTGVAAVRGRNEWKNASNIYNDAENNTPSTNAMPVYIGNEKATTGRFISGFEAEIVVFNAPLNAAGEIIVNNYLAAKYNVTLAANDFYAGDTPGNGDFDFEMGGIGQSALNGRYLAGDNTSVSSTVTGGLDITEGANQFGDGEYLMAAHQTGSNYINYSDISGMSAGPLVGRWNRIWYFDWTHVAGSESADLTFDMSDGGMGAITPAAPLTNYKLLYRAGTSGAWTEVMNATSITGDRIFFDEVPNTRGDGYYTIGTLNNAASPLPIELVDFDAKVCGRNVCTSWTTATEVDNDFFTIERSSDGVNFEAAGTKDGAGSSSSVHHYNFVDHTPFEGRSYYRLKQTDFDGSSVYSSSKTVDFDGAAASAADENFSMNVFPNPSDGSSINLSFNGVADRQEVLVVVYNTVGQESYSKIIVTGTGAGNSVYAIDPENRLNAGVYLITATSKDQYINKKLIIK